MKKIISLSLGVCAMLLAPQAFASHPLITDDAGVVEVKHAEIELNGAYNYNKHNDGGVTSRYESNEAELKITTGIYKDLHAAITVPYTINAWSSDDNIMAGRASGFGDMTFELKYKMLELYGVDFTIKPYTFIPTGKRSAGLSDGRWGFGGALIATKEFDEGKYAVHINAGYEHHNFHLVADRDANRLDLWSGSIAGEAEVFNGLKAMVNFGISTTAEKAVKQPAAFALVGVSYQLIKNLEINSGIKFGLTRGEDDLSLLYGITLKF
jgi:Putative MetA-pathway of phenol degradation